MLGADSYVNVSSQHIYKIILLVATYQMSRSIYHVAQKRVTQHDERITTVMQLLFKL